MSRIIRRPAEPWMSKKIFKPLFEIRTNYLVRDIYGMNKEC